MTSEELHLLVGKLQEELREKSNQIKELTNSVNAALTKGKNNKQSVTDSLEYKALESENYALASRVKELEQIIKIQMKENPDETFQNASSMQMHPPEIEFPAKQLSTFFLDSRNAKQCMFLKLDGNQVKGWESDAKRKT